MEETVVCQARLTIVFFYKLKCKPFKCLDNTLENKINLFFFKKKEVGKLHALCVRFGPIR